MILTFKDSKTEMIFEGKDVAKLDAGTLHQVRRVLDQIEYGRAKGDFVFPMWNRFYAYKGSDKCLIWVNQSWQISFNWRDHDAYDVCLEPINEDSPYYGR